MDELGDVLEEIDIFFLRPTIEKVLSGCPGYIGIVIQCYFAVDASAQGCNECLQVVKIARTNNFVEKKALESGQLH